HEARNPPALLQNQRCATMTAHIVKRPDVACLVAHDHHRYAQTVEAYVRALTRQLRHMPSRHPRLAPDMLHLQIVKTLIEIATARYLRQNRKTLRICLAALLICHSLVGIFRLSRTHPPTPPQIRNQSQFPATYPLSPNRSTNNTRHTVR